MGRMQDVVDVEDGVDGTDGFMQRSSLQGAQL